MTAARQNLPLARYTDARGRSHLVVLRGRLVLDLQSGGRPRVVAELTADESTEQARAVLHGDGGYLDRARSSDGPLCRALGIEDVRGPASEPGDEPLDQGEHSAGVAA